MSAFFSTSRAGPDRPARLTLRIGGAIAAAMLLAAAPSPASAQLAPSALEMAVRSEAADPALRSFYAARAFRPLWMTRSGPSEAALELADLLSTARWDGLDPNDVGARSLARALLQAESGSPRALARAELAASRAFATYVRALRRPPPGVIWVDQQLAPRPPSAREVLDEAAAAPMLADHVGRMLFLHPLYGQLRAAALGEGLGRGRDAQAELARINLERVRMLPVDRGQRYVLVDAAAARLYMYEGGRVRDSMRVVVGRETDPTPMMAGLIRHTIVNPYWNLPNDLVAERVATRVLDEGLGYLKAKRYQVLSDWGERPAIVDPSDVDWRAVAAGRMQVRMRQLPGPSNAMGKMKFMFPNAQGIYLHDTPDATLFSEAARLFSAGCVRLEDAPRLARWLYGKPLNTRIRETEKQVDLPKPVPVYITYLTAAPDNGAVAYRTDVYKRDFARLASLAS